MNRATTDPWHNQEEKGREKEVVLVVQCSGGGGGEQQMQKERNKKINEDDGKRTQCYFSTRSTLGRFGANERDGAGLVSEVSNAS